MWASICTVNPSSVSGRGEPPSSICLPPLPRKFWGCTAMLLLDSWNATFPPSPLGCLSIHRVQAHTDPPEVQSYFSCSFLPRGKSCFLMLLISGLPQDSPLSLFFSFCSSRLHTHWVGKYEQPDNKCWGGYGGKWILLHVGGSRLT